MIESKKITCRDLEKEFYIHTWQRYEILGVNIYLDWLLNEMDLLGVRKSGFVDEIEIKLTAADFRADFKKTVTRNEGIEHIGLYQRPKFVKKLKHDVVAAGQAHCNYFSFLVPEHLVDKCEIPDHAGLYVCRRANNGILKLDEVKSAPRLHNRKISEKHKYQIGRKMAYRYWRMK